MNVTSKVMVISMITNLGLSIIKIVFGFFWEIWGFNS